MTLDKQTWQSMIRNHLDASAHPLIVILGPTASGKTGFSIDVAKWLQANLGKTAEVINADSRQMYKAMDIGTAKVTNEQMQGIPHHLINLYTPDEDCNAALFQNNADAIIQNLHAEGKIPLLVGGSMLYIAAITDGLSFDKDIRSELRSPEASCKYDVLILGLGKERSEVVAKINNRTAVLFDEGWIEEVRTLLAAGYTKAHPGMKACGYREIADYLQCGGDEEKLKESIAAKTRQYARRQMTWWRGDTRIHWL